MHSQIPPQINDSPPIYCVSDGLSRLTPPPPPIASTDMMMSGYPALRQTRCSDSCVITVSVFARRSRWMTVPSLDLEVSDL